jgi:hypothetical protein
MRPDRINNPGALTHLLPHISTVFLHRFLGTRGTRFRPVLLGTEATSLLFAQLQ